MFYYLCRSELNGTHVRLRSRHSSQISPKGRCTSDRAGSEECEAQTGLWRNPITHLHCAHAHNYACTHLVYLYIMETGCLTLYVQYALNDAKRPSRRERSIIQKHYSHSKQLPSVCTLKLLWLELEQVKNVTASVLSHKHTTSRQSVSDGAGPTVNGGVWITSSVVFGLFILRHKKKKQLQCAAEGVCFALS